MDWFDYIGNYIGEWLNSWGPVSFASLLGVLFAESLKSFIKTVFDHASKKKLQEQKFDLERSLEEFKSSLQEGLDKRDRIFHSMIEAVKFDFNRREKDFSLYSSKRHETYLLLHQALLDAKSRLMSLRGYTTFPDFKKLSLSEIEAWLDKNSFVDLQKHSVLDFWENDKIKAVKNAMNLETLLRQNETGVAITEAQNTMLDYQLYLSDEVFSCSNELVSDMCKLYANYKLTGLDAVKIHKESEMVKERIGKEFNELTKKMKAELQKGYYEEIK